MKRNLITWLRARGVEITNPDRDKSNDEILTTEGVIGGK